MTRAEVSGTMTWPTCRGMGKLMIRGRRGEGSSPRFSMYDRGSLTLAWRGHVMNEEQTRIRAYLQAQAAKLSPEALLEKLRADQDTLRSAATAIPADRFGDRPGEAVWSAHEVMAHAVDYGARVARGIAAALDGGAPQSPGQDAVSGDVPPLRSAAAWAAELEASRATLYDRVRRATGDEHLAVRWDHPTFGDLNWREWLLFMRIHDVDHTGQLRQIAAALGAAADRAG